MKTKIYVVIGLVLLFGLLFAAIAMSNGSKTSSDVGQTLTKQEVINRVGRLKSFEEKNPEVVYIGNLTIAEKQIYTVYDGVESGDYVVILRADNQIIFYSPDDNSIIRTDNIKQAAN